MYILRSINKLCKPKKNTCMLNYRPYNLCRRIGVSYKDVPDVDASENLFYIYYLGRYNNKAIYHYGETLNLYNVEFDLCKKLPYYKNLISIPTDYHTDGNEKFANFLKQNKLNSVFSFGIENIFNTSDNVDIDMILASVSEIFKEVEIVLNFIFFNYIYMMTFMIIILMSIHINTIAIFTNWCKYIQTNYNLVFPYFIT